MEATIRETRIGAAKAPAAQAPSRPSAGEFESRLNISVIFTSVEDTLAALRAAGQMADKLNARITLVVPEVVSYQLPLDKPPVLHDWNRRRFRVLAAQSAVETTVKFYFCRDRNQTLAKVLKPNSLVVVGGRKRIWPTAESRLVNRLRKLGHQAVLAETE